MNYKKFAEIRQKRGKSQLEVAVSMGLSLTGYRNKEKGRSVFHADEIEPFAEAVGLTVKEVLDSVFFDKKVP